MNGQALNTVNRRADDEDTYPSISTLFVNMSMDEVMFCASDRFAEYFVLAFPVVRGS